MLMGTRKPKKPKTSYYNQETLRQKSKDNSRQQAVQQFQDTLPIFDDDYSPMGKSFTLNNNNRRLSLNHTQKTGFFQMRQKKGANSVTVANYLDTVSKMQSPERTLQIPNSSHYVGNLDIINNLQRLEPKDNLQMQTPMQRR